MKNGKMDIVAGGCPECEGDLVISYKYGALYKCLRCKKVFPPADTRVRAAVLRHKLKKARKRGIIRA